MYMQKNNVKKICAAIVAVAMQLTIPLFVVSEQKVSFSSWKQVVQQMEIHLNKAYDLYTGGKPKQAYDEVNTAYFRFYESKGMEKITMSYLSGARKTAVENAFYQYRKNVRVDKNAVEVKACKDELIAMLYQDAAALDGSAGDAGTGHGVFASAFIACFALLLREGLEAILVIAAIIAYLVKTGKKRYLFSVYIGALSGVLISILLAYLFNLVAGAQAGIAREIFEGVGMFVAVAMLFYVSNWMLSKSETEAWERYIQKKVEASVSAGNKWLLIFTAFIAVAREGAELILFFQGVPVHGAEGRRAMIFAIVAAVFILIAVFLVFRFLTVRLPLKPFFIVTSVFMYVMCFSFTGKGVGELQAAGVCSKTQISWMKPFEVDLLGIYASYESIIPQLIVLVVTVITAVLYYKQNRAVLTRLQAEQKQGSIR